MSGELPPLALPALRVEELAARAFRNLASLDLTPGPRVNVLSGDNGQGKSNVLEAIYYLGTLASFRGASGSDLVQHGADTASLGVRLSATPLSRTLKARIHRRAARELGLDGKRPRSIAAWRGVAPMVLFHPGDLELAQGGPDGRRAFLDRMLEEIDPAYGATREAYEKARSSRNKLLKSETPEPRAIVAFDPILAESGAVLVRARRELVAALGSTAERVAAEILGHELPLDVRYSPRVDGDANALREALARSLTKDLARGFTAEGPHADDVVLSVRAHSARHHASQGQQRTIVLALKVAELEALARRTGRVPVLLLDDVSSELDRTRSRRFFAVLARTEAQVFLTTTAPELIHVEGERADFVVEAGRVESR